eukprot:gnl/TRDRNA2_/TRDRNA2_184980_c0_seq1.p1 gnl/TRDRNA2_/TRDRNA2_184980_c0~~gnl/TRDRNA2_/TRDRNA2_184980_c0_seq1.p1  ORF type:complete len:500 (+),score=59.82 gnl/TRDRNA2_/TRDRNA2_184980_c0_seq1:78-1577(+)
MFWASSSSKYSSVSSSTGGTLSSSAGAIARRPGGSAGAASGVSSPPASGSSKAVPTSTISRPSSRRLGDLPHRLLNPGAISPVLRHATEEAARPLQKTNSRRVLKPISGSREHSPTPSPTPPTPEPRHSCGIAVSSRLRSSGSAASLTAERMVNPPSSPPAPSRTPAAAWPPTATAVMSPPAGGDNNWPVAQLRRTQWPNLDIAPKDADMMEKLYSVVDGVLAAAFPEVRCPYAWPALEEPAKVPNEQEVLNELSKPYSFVDFQKSWDFPDDVHFGQWCQARMRGQPEREFSKAPSEAEVLTVSRLQHSVEISPRVSPRVSPRTSPRPGSKSPRPSRSPRPGSRPSSHREQREQRENVPALVNAAELPKGVGGSCEGPSKPRSMSGSRSNRSRGDGSARNGDSSRHDTPKLLSSRSCRSTAALGIRESRERADGEELKSSRREQQHAAYSIQGLGSAPGRPPTARDQHSSGCQSVRLGQSGSGGRASSLKTLRRCYSAR